MQNTYSRLFLRSPGGRSPSSWHEGWLFVWSSSFFFHVQRFYDSCRFCKWTLIRCSVLFSSQTQPKPPTDVYISKWVDPQASCTKYIQSIRKANKCILQDMIPYHTLSARRLIHTTDNMMFVVYVLPGFHAHQYITRIQAIYSSG